MRVLLWNVEWKSPRSRNGKLLRTHWLDDPPNLLCLAESTMAMLPNHGHAITSEADYGYPNNEARRKVLLWSPSPWRDVDAVGHAALPPGRYVAGVTETPLGPVEVHGICIPWAAAHVSSGRRDRHRWEDHCAYLDGLRRILSRPAPHPRIVLGDFNQAVPRTRAPRDVHEKLLHTLGPLRIGTPGLRDDNDKPLVCHLAHDDTLIVQAVNRLPRKQDRLRLSDHDGLQIFLRASTTDS